MGRVTILFAVFLSTSTALAGDVYVVQHGDALSRIAQNALGKPVYGKKGNLAKLLVLNPEVRDPDLIFPGEKIELGESKLASEATQLSQPFPFSALARTPASDLNPPPLAPGIPKESFELTPTYEFLHLTVQDNTTGAQASIYSSAVLGADLRWNHFFSPETTGFFQAGIRHYSLTQPNAVGTLSETDPTTWDFEVGEARKFSDSFSASFDVGYGQVLSLSSLNASTLSVDLIRVPRLDLGGHYLFSKSEDFETGMKAGVSLLLPGNAQSYRSRLGYGENASIYASNGTFSVSGGVLIENLSTDFSSIQEMNFVFQAGMSFDLFGKKRVKE